MDHRLHVLGYHWRAGFPTLRLRDGAGAPTELALEPGSELHVALGPKKCIGHRLGDERIPCPRHRALSSGVQCDHCQRQDTFRPCMTCDGSRCPRLHPAARRSCRSTHHLYLADFGGELLKVGTAADARRDARLHDQGPIAALRVARGPGPEIKQIERFASTRTELVEAFRRDLKRRLLSSPVTPEQALDRLTDALADLVSAGPPFPERFAKPVSVALPPLQRATRERIRHQARLPVQPSTVVRGRVAGAVGGIVLLEQDAGEVLLELGQLTAHTLDPDPPGDLPPPRMQLGLF